MRRQRPLRGGRKDVWSKLDPQVKAWVLRECRRNGGCSESMLVNNAIGWVAGIDLADPLKARRKRR